MSEYLLSTRHFINCSGIVSENKRSIDAVYAPVAVNVVQLELRHDLVAENRHTVFRST